MSKVTLEMGFFVIMSRMMPCMYVTSPPGAGESMMLSPSLRQGALGDQKGPRMAEEVGVAPVSEATWLEISVIRDSMPVMSEMRWASLRAGVEI